MYNKVNQSYIYIHPLLDTFPIEVIIEYWVEFLVLCSKSLLVIYLMYSRQWQPTPVLLPGKSHGWRSLVGYSPWGRKESDMTEQLHFHFSLSTFMHWRRKWWPTPVFLPGESQGWEAWWAAVYGVAQSRTWLKRLSSSNAADQWWSEPPCLRKSCLHVSRWIPSV